MRSLVVWTIVHKADFEVITWTHLHNYDYAHSSMLHTIDCINLVTSRF